MAPRDHKAIREREGQEGTMTFINVPWLLAEHICVLGPLILRLLARSVSARRFRSLADLASR